MSSNDIYDTVEADLRALIPYRSAVKSAAQHLEAVRGLHSITPLLSSKRAQLENDITACENALCDAIESLVTLDKRVISWLNHLSGYYRALLEEHYVHGDGWAVVGRRHNMSTRTAFIFRKAAIEQIVEAIQQGILPDTGEV